MTLKVLHKNGPSLITSRRISIGHGKQYYDKEGETRISGRMKCRLYGCLPTGWGEALYHNMHIEICRIHSFQGVDVAHSECMFSAVTRLLWIN